MSGAFYQAVEAKVSQTTSRSFQIVNRTSLAGGCISKAERLDGSDRSYFLKRNTESFLIHFEEEQAALDELSGTRTIRVPEPICSGTAENQSYLVLEFISSGRPAETSWERLGEQLAQLHQSILPHFGWHRDNTIGATKQINSVSDDWISFFHDRRLLHQIDLAQENGFKLENGPQLLTSLSSFFDGYSPSPSLLHGDLWSGNVGFDTIGAPFVFDPCCYYGDREADLAFTEFFGGFHPKFYAAYNNAYPLDHGYAQRKILYNLYHCLNHFNLFGSPYDSQSQSMTNQLLKFV